MLAYSGVPTPWLSFCEKGICSPVRVSANFFANPKSITLTLSDDVGRDCVNVSGPMRKLAGLMSRWTKSLEWMNSISVS